MSSSLHLLILVVLATFLRTEAFLASPLLSTDKNHRRTTAYGMIRNPFSASDPLTPGESSLPSDEDDGIEFEASSMGLIRQARRLLASDFGILDGSYLDDTDFVWIGPFVDQPLSKTEYLAAGRFFDLRSAFPDLDYRPHDFRIDEKDPYTIRISCRTTGTMRGALRLRTGTFPPTGGRMKCPPEAVTITFNKYGKAIKLCTGFCMDRQVGNTKGGTGVIAAALVAGQPPSDWDLYPAPAVIKRFFGRPIEPILETKSVLAPFPETVMIQLAKGLLATNMAADDPSLLSERFEFMTPYYGPIRKPEFLQKFAVNEFDGVDPSFSHFRVDPYDPVRVWVDVLPTGPGYSGCPQAMSFSFDEEGFCERITSSYILDPSIGNGGGLGGPEGLKYATGNASPDIFTRPWARVLGRARKQILSPLTGVGVDDYETSAMAKAKASSGSVPSPPGGTPPSELLKPSPAERLSTLKLTSTSTEPNVPQASPAASTIETNKEIVEEETKLKQQGAEEAKLLLAEVEEAEKRALEARLKLAKLEAERAESERKFKEAQLQREARTLELEQEKAAQDAERAREAKKKAALEQEKKQAQEEEKRKKLVAEKEALAKKKAAAAAEAKRATATKKQAPAASAKATKADTKKKQEFVPPSLPPIFQNPPVFQNPFASGTSNTAVSKPKNEPSPEIKKRQDAKRAEALKKKEEAAKKRQAAMKAQRAAAEESKKRKLEAQLAVKKAKEDAIRKKKEEQAKAIKAKEDAMRKKKEEQAKAIKAKEDAIRKKKEEEAKAIVDAELKAKRIQDAEAAKVRQQEALDAIQSAVSRATVSLFGLVNSDDEEKEEEDRSPFAKQQKTPTGAPKGVPVLKGWRKSKDGAVTGRLYGSKTFDDGSLITTSPIAFGKVAKKEIVKTASGSKYYLN